LRLIAEGALDEGGIEQLAERLGVTGRHLRRLFCKHLGASPLAVAHTQRLHFAKRLIDDTDLPMTQISIASGYGSLRRFNDAFRNTYGRAPRELRKRRENSVALAGVLSVRLPWQQPFDAAGILNFLAGRATPGVEQLIGERYLRTIVINGEVGVIDCRADLATNSLRLRVHGVATQSLLPLVQRVREMFDLDAPVSDIAAVLALDATLADLLRQRPGIRVPGAWDGFELTVRAILGQQVSVKAATTLAGRIAARYGERVTIPSTLKSSEDELALNRLFPTPQKLARARFNDLGITGGRIDTIKRVAEAVCNGSLVFDTARDADELCRALMSIKGIGDWTAQYVAMRAVKHPDAFPASDLGLLQALGLKGAPGAKILHSRAEAWRPWRAYAALLLWGSLSNSGG
jgi:AraC family transcriptional regulator of adaptative response / DNA-3-methyladenine glycosylase II